MERAEVIKYLHDVLILEFYEKKTKQSTSNLENGINSNEKKLNTKPQKPIMPKEPSIWEERDGQSKSTWEIISSFLLGSIIGVVLGGVFFSCLGGPFVLLYSYCVNGTATLEEQGVAVPVVLYFIVVFILSGVFHVRFYEMDGKYKEKKEEYLIKLERYNMVLYPKYQEELAYYKKYGEMEYLKKYKKDQYELKRKIETWEKRLCDYQAARYEISQMKSKAYAYNIIPSKYRGLFPVLFIYDYMKTSGESLSDALLHCELDRIEQLLTTIIRQNEEIIMKNAYLAAQNRKIIQQNKERQETENRIEENTANAAFYSSIAAINTVISHYDFYWD